MTIPLRSRSINLQMRLRWVKESFNKITSFLLPGAVTKGETTFPFLSEMATILSPLWCLCPLKPRLSPPFLATVEVPSPWRIEGSSNSFF